MITRKCVVCGKAFDCYPSDNRVTCSMDCRRERQRRVRTGDHRTWSQDAKSRLSSKGKTQNLQLGTAAAMRSPIAGRHETNQASKLWVLVTPSGEEIPVRNLRLWAREHTDLFGKPPGDRSADQIAAGFRAIAATLSGKRPPGSRGRPAYTYFGWSLKGPPDTPSTKKTAPGE